MVILGREIRIRKVRVQPWVAIFSLLIETLPVTAQKINFLSVIQRSFTKEKFAYANFPGFEFLRTVSSPQSVERSRRIRPVDMRTCCFAYKSFSFFSRSSRYPRYQMFFLASLLQQLLANRVYRRRGGYLRSLMKKT